MKEVGGGGEVDFGGGFQRLLCAFFSNSTYVRKYVRTYGLKSCVEKVYIKNQL